MPLVFSHLDRVQGTNPADAGSFTPKEILMQNENNRRLFKSRIAIGLLAIMLCTPSLSLGWGAGGHMMTASIAFERLNLRAKAQAIELLARPIEPTDIIESTDFVNASHWADDLRSDSAFDFLKPFHFITLSFSTDGTTLPTGVPEPNNIVKGLEDNVNILRTSTDKDEQAMALRLIIHFVGDIHQPLHCASQVSNPFPDGNRGGNFFPIRVGNKTTNLHSYWDGGIDAFPKGGPNFAPPPLSQIPAAVSAATAGNPATDPKLKLDDPFIFNAWAGESHALAKNTAYKGIRMCDTPTATYNTNALKVARQRVAWGGYRLAALLNAIWP
jgi:hypothetical protein